MKKIFSNVFHKSEKSTKNNESPEKSKNNEYPKREENKALPIQKEITKRDNQNNLSLIVVDYWCGFGCGEYYYLVLVKENETWKISMEILGVDF